MASTILDLIEKANASLGQTAQEEVKRRKEQQTAPSKIRTVRPVSSATNPVKEAAKQLLSTHDLTELSAGSQAIVKEAKADYDRAKAAGDRAGMAAAHEKAETARRQHGYSGGVTGSEYIAPELTAREKIMLTEEGEQQLRKARLEGDADREKDVLSASGFREYTNAAENQKKREQTEAALKAAGTGFAGSLLSLHETARQAMRNYQQDRWGMQPEGARRTVDPNLTGQQLLRASEEYARQATAGKNDISRFLTETAISGTQMLPSIAASFIPGVGPAVGAGIMGLQSAGAKAYEVNESGAEAGEAMTRGLLSGGIEGLTEKIGLGNLVKIVNRSGGASFLKNVAQQAGIEATEESASYVLNLAMDKAAEDPNAQFSLADLAQNAAAGALLGGTFAGAGTAVNRAINRPAQTQQEKPENPLLRASGFYDRQAENTPEEVQEQAEETTSVNADPAQHTVAEQEVIDGYRASVDDAIRDTFQEYFEDPGKGFSRHNISDVSARQAEDASALLGGEYKGYKNAINANGIRHILKEHGPNGATDHSFADLNDAARLGYVLGNYDDVKVVSYRSGDADLSAEFRTKDNRPAPMLEFSKKVNGTYYIVEAIPESKYKKFWVVSAYMKKADGSTQAPDALSPENTPNTSLASLPSANSSIAENVENSNPKFEAMGAMSRGGAGDFATWQAETPGNQFHAINEQGAGVTAEERGRAPVEVPTINLDGRLTSKAVSTFANANILPNEMVTAVESNLADGAYSRLAYTDSQALQDAEAIIKEKGYQGAKEYWLTQTAGGRINKANSTLGIALINRAANSPSLHVDAMDLLSRYADYAKDAGQALQAMNMINKLTPQGQLYTMVKAIEHLEERAAQNGTAVNVDINPELVTAFMEAETQQERNEIKQAMIKDAAAQLPATWRDRFDSWRYLSMLGNARTHFRNITGNAGFAVVRGVKDVTAAALERSLGVKDRKNSVLNRFNAEDRARLTIARGEFPEVKELVLSGGKYMDDYSQINRERDVWKFDNKLLNAAFKPVSYLANKNSELLDKEDILFAKPAYTGALARYLKANNITALEYANMLPGDTRKQEAQAHAIKEAQKATYRDTNAFSEALSQISRMRYSDNKAVRSLSYLAEGVFPFKKTPANILVRGVEYSPIGLAKGLADAAISNRAESWGAKEEGKNILSKKLVKLEKDLASNAKTPAEAIDEVAAGLTGTGLLGLGMALAYLGIATGGTSDDNKQDDFNELQGHQNYSLEIGNRSFTLDWLAPEALPFFVGVELTKFLQQRSEGEATADDLVSSLMRIADPMLEMSMLQGLNDLFTAFGSDYALSSAAWTAATSYLTQFLPTVAGQIERIGEPTRESTFIDPNSGVPKGLQYLLGTIGNKIPGWDYNQVDYVDAWGRTEGTDNLALRAFNNLINPAYYSEIQTGGTEAELQRLYDLGYDSVLPSSFQKSAEINGEKVSADQWLSMQTTRGQTAKSVLDSFIGTERYNAMTDDERAKFVKKVLEYGSDAGKVAGGADADETFARWQQAAKDANAAVGLSEAEVIAASAYQSVLGEDAGDETKASIKQGMYEQWVDSRNDLTDEQKSYLKNNIKFYQMIPADASAYNKAVAAGYEDPEEIQALFENRKNYDVDGDGSYTGNTETIHYISSATEDAEEREKMWNALKEKGEERTFAQVEKEYRSKISAIQTAKTNLDNAVSAETQSAFAAAVSNSGADSQKELKKALLSVDATEAERIAYYNLESATRGWKRSWYNVRM